MNQPITSLHQSNNVISPPTFFPHAKYSCLKKSFHLIWLLHFGWKNRDSTLNIFWFVMRVVFVFVCSFPALPRFTVAVTMTTRKNSAGISRKRPQACEEPGTLVLFLADYSRTDCFRNLLFHIDSFERLYIPADCHF